MDNTSYEQYELTKVQVDEAAKYLKEGMVCSMVLFNNNPISVSAPNHVILKIEYCEPAMRGNTALAAHPVYEMEVEPEPERFENVIPIGQRCSILELTEEKCHWPIGDPGHADFFFCGGKTLIGMPYCGYHARVAYQPPSDRRRDRRSARA